MQLERSETISTSMRNGAPAALRLPEFLIIGAAKSATTSLYEHLRLHSQIAPCRKKEPMFFAWDDVYQRGIQWYGSLFEDAKKGQLCFEASTGYTRWPQVPCAAERIAKHLPDVRLIYMMRHPVDRAYSHYVHRYTKELHPGEPVRETFEQFIEREPVCIDSSMYMRQIEQYLAHFPREHMLFLLTEDFQRDRAGVLRGIAEFLGVRDESEQIASAAHERANHSAYYQYCQIRKRIMEPLKRVPVVGAFASRLPQTWRDRGYELLLRTPYGSRRARGVRPAPMRPETRDRLLSHFARPNRQLASFLGRDLSIWSS